MLNNAVLTGSALENLDRGVVLAAVAGLVANAFDQSLVGFLLTLFATCVYGIVRNRIENLDQFEECELAEFPVVPGINFTLFTVLCQWLGSKELYYGLLGDLVDPDTGSSAKELRQYLRETLAIALLERTKIKILALFWLDRFVR